MYIIYGCHDVNGMEGKVLERSDSVDGLDLEADLAFPVLVRWLSSINVAHLLLIFYKSIPGLVSISPPVSLCKRIRVALEVLIGIATHTIIRFWVSSG